MLDLVHLQQPLVATLGHVNSNVHLQFFDMNAPNTNAFLIGLSNDAFIITKENSAAGAIKLNGQVSAVSLSGDGNSLSNLNAGNIASGTLSASRGGTGTASYTVGDILYASAPSSLSKLADVATGNALISGGVGVAPTWGKVGLTTHVAGTLGAANGGTGSSNLSANKVLVGNGTSAVLQPSNLHWDNTNSRLGIGTTPIVTLHVNGNLVVSNALTLYLLSTPVAHEWQYVGAVGPTLQVTFNFSTATPLKAVLADVFLGGSSISDHQNFKLGRYHSNGRNYTNRDVAPSTVFQNAVGQFITLTLNGDSDGFSQYYGVWQSSQIIPVESNGAMYFSNNGGNSGSSGWIYMVTRGYYL